MHDKLRIVYDYDTLDYRVERITERGFELVARCNTESEAEELITQLYQ